jgi:hypothetical protein
LKIGDLIMATDTSASGPIKHKSQWLLIALLMASSFACVFISAQAALMSETERVINANMLAESGAQYDLDNEDQFGFAPLDSNVIIEATRDANGLQITPSTPNASDAPVLIVKLPDTATPTPTQIPDTMTPTVVSQATATHVPPSETPVPPSATLIPASETPLPPTLTNTSTPKPILSTWTPIPTTKKPKKPTDTPIPPTDTPIPPTATNTNTANPTEAPTFTLLPSLTPTSTSSSTPSFKGKHTPTPTEP